MSGVPYIRFFGDDWLSGTQELTLEERGALITIAALTSTLGRAPEADFRRLSRRFGCTPGRAKRLVNSLVEQGKILLENGSVINQRAVKETTFSQKNSKKQSENASQRWAKKSEKPNENNNSEDAMGMPSHMPWECQPEPEPEEKEDTNVSSKKKRGTRLSEQWELPIDWGNWALENGWPESVIRLEADKFRDHWISQSGQKGVKLDWLATWRNWMRNSKSPKAVAGGQHGKPSKQASRVEAFIAGARGAS